MKRTKLKDRILPTYTKGEEIFNMTSHIVGAVLGFVATVLCVVYWKWIWSCKWSNIWIYYDFIVYHVKYLPWTKS